jgi:hypothetical protein
MDILPLRTAPPKRPIDRRHVPRLGRFSTYRPCLAWEFGFSCAFCLVHTADLNEHDFKGLGLMWIEHHLTQSERPDLADSYENCFYSCRFCNQARADAPAQSGGRRLLEPCDSPWGNHFSLNDDVLQSLDSDATYTEQTYDLNEPRRLTLRRARAETLGEAIRILRELPSRVAHLSDLAGELSPEEGRQVLEVAADCRLVIEKARQQLRRFRAIPSTAPSPCRCDTPVERSLPAFLAEQAFSIDDPT